MPSILITGDVTLDCNIARLPGPTSALVTWSEQDQAQVHWERGGAALLSDLIEAVLANPQQDGCMVYGPKTPKDLRDHHDVPLSKTYTVWMPHGKERVWRVDRFLGLNRPSADSLPTNQTTCKEGALADILVLNDTAMGFRDQPKLWPECIVGGKAPRWIVLKTSRPDATIPLWRDALSKHHDKLIVVCTANSLREGGAHISRGISWERTVQDLLWELNYRAFGEQALSAKPAVRCARVVVSFGAAGTFVFNPTATLSNGQKRAILVFDPQGVEGSWEEQHPGQVMGYLSCTAAAVVRALVEKVDEPNLVIAANAGIHALRLLHSEGYGKLNTKSVSLPKTMGFPHLAVAQCVADCWKNPVECGLVDIAIPESAALGSRDGALWSILNASSGGSLDKLATRLVREGPEAALQGIPWVKFGKFRTADRREIESCRSVRNLMADFIQKPGSKPMSIAVFGPPGSGKSFVVKAIATEIGENQKQPLTPLTFNLSQFQTAQDLNSALHRVRDAALSGALPLVFWDEFDTNWGGNDLGWLRLFLEPMQDGTFLEGQISHPIGKAIFVFAGGTCNSLAEFNKGLDDKPFRTAKGPDFISRLRGFLDVLGPNPINGNENGDSCFVMRRAILLRSLIEGNYPDLLSGRTIKIDEGVLGAFLGVSRYKHGSRSLESIVMTSSLIGRTQFNRSSLPPVSQLDLHMDGFEFHALVQQPDGLERLSRALHENYCKKLVDRGYKFGEKADEAAKISPSLRSFEDLPPDMQKDNREAAKAMPAKLAICGYAIVPTRLGSGITDFPKEDIEKMAEKEHDRWLRAKIADDWTYGTPRDNKTKKHPAMLPWQKLTAAEREALYPENPLAVGLEALPDNEKQKDRDQFEGLPAMLVKYGCTVVKLGK